MKSDADILTMPDEMYRRIYGAGRPRRVKRGHRISLAVHVALMWGMIAYMVLDTITGDGWGFALDVFLLIGNAFGAADKLREIRANYWTETDYWWLSLGQ